MHYNLERPGQSFEDATPDEVYEGVAKLVHDFFPPQESELCGITKTEY